MRRGIRRELGLGGGGGIMLLFFMMRECLSGTGKERGEFMM